MVRTSYPADRHIGLQNERIREWRPRAMSLTSRAAQGQNSVVLAPKRKRPDLGLGLDTAVLEPLPAFYLFIGVLERRVL